MNKVNANVSWQDRAKPIRSTRGLQAHGQGMCDGFGVLIIREHVTLFIFNVYCWT